MVDTSDLASVSRQKMPTQSPARPVATPGRPRYRLRVGVRSYIYQVSLVVWTCIMAVIAVGWVGLIVVNTASNPDADWDKLTLPEKAERQNQRAFEMTNPALAAGMRHAAIAASLATLGATWFAVAFPLFLCAVGTLDTGKPK